MIRVTVESFRHENFGRIIIYFASLPESMGKYWFWQSSESVK